MNRLKPSIVILLTSIFAANLAQAIPSLCAFKCGANRVLKEANAELLAFVSLCVGSDNTAVCEAQIEATRQVRMHDAAIDEYTCRLSCPDPLPQPRFLIEFFGGGGLWEEIYMSSFYDPNYTGNEPPPGGGDYLN